MQHVCTTLSEKWDLPMPCDCMTGEICVYKGTRMRPSLTTMGFTTHLHGMHPLCSTHNARGQLPRATENTLPHCWHPTNTHANTYLIPL